MDYKIIEVFQRLICYTDKGEIFLGIKVLVPIRVGNPFLASFIAGFLALKPGDTGYTGTFTKDYG